MKMRPSACTLLICCSVLWVAPSSSSSPSTVKASPPHSCHSNLTFSSEVISSAEGNGDIHVRSLSPWIWRASTVKNQISSTIWEAECVSSFCVSPNPEQEDGTSLNSVPIYQNILVLQRQGRGGCYRASYRSVAVGCTCVRTKSN
ncbi:interleukin 17a/f2 [Cheilinus undulatus]|uniref:interleukin 17a/f2 n=1 Tax=Cheilinus undulatus TaxID=241271 RepID=UPI001BD61D4E|nr:interleukin 17a/f2 [Cheilinus undulatus]